jgi:hypothetical protein
MQKKQLKPHDKGFEDFKEQLSDHLSSLYHYHFIK